MQTICCWLLVALASVGFVHGVYTDFHGSEAKEPGGFAGFIGSVIVFGFTLAVLYGSGALDYLFSWK